MLVRPPWGDSVVPSRCRALSLPFVALLPTFVVAVPLRAVEDEDRGKPEAEAGKVTAVEKPAGEDKNKGDGKEKKEPGPMKADTFSGLALRSIGPAMVSGRISDIAVHPKDKAIRYVASSTGGLWNRYFRGIAS